MNADADKQKVRVGLLGVGLMGSAMGHRLLDQGIEVIAWNRSPERVIALEERGARRADDPAEVALDTDVVITMLPTAPIVLDIVEPLLGDWPQETVWLQMSSVGAAEADQLVEVAQAHDVTLVDAPVSGSTHPAQEGELTILASGPDSARPPVEPNEDPRSSSAPIGSCSSRLRSKHYVIWDRGRPAPARGAGRLCRIASASGMRSAAETSAIRKLSRPRKGNEEGRTRSGEKLSLAQTAAIYPVIATAVRLAASRVAQQGIESGWDDAVFESNFER